MKIFAFYLPQFHTITENDLWWGKGFTEWTNVKKSKPLFFKHNQPRIPLNENYYNLLNKETLLWQAELLKKYKLDGLCFYHYWFNGKLLLEKPAELLLKEKSIDLPFFFSWANEPWTRSWDGKNKDILIDQSYGDELDWIKHFNYMLPFFKDARYLKHNGFPVFVIYRSASFERCQEWIACWRSLAANNGLGNIHFISTLTSFENDNREIDFDAEINFEPLNTLTHHMNIYGKKSFLPRIKHSINKRISKLMIIATNTVNITQVPTFDYDLTWKTILNKKFNQNLYAGGFVDWDNTARKSNNGLVAVNGNPDKFKKYFYKLYIKAIKEDSPYIFINAWNEWAEGTYLEPDTKHKYKYLEAIRDVVENNHK
ncbi:glycosyl transferase [Acinetobacter sp. 194]|uniref:glycosyltransferase WbsX family protein n=1 Tax=Acinetobacter shaoyimingii TaxID=2715164 RepID=UPI00140E074A|nr:glycoside hydrolase family 99-like domain-containing protein [Acinetobacter shaoyimingii]NHB58721.1 glycosyl transferase [Acinetobacter shaoyimingii]